MMLSVTAFRGTLDKRKGASWTYDTPSFFYCFVPKGKFCTKTWDMCPES